MHPFAARGIDACEIRVARGAAAFNDACRDLGDDGMQ
jgi:hypothetical protein